SCHILDNWQSRFACVVHRSDRVQLLPTGSFYCGLQTAACSVRSLFCILSSISQQKVCCITRLQIELFCLVMHICSAFSFHTMHRCTRLKALYGRVFQVESIWRRICTHIQESNFLNLKIDLLLTNC